MIAAAMRSSVTVLADPVHTVHRDLAHLSLMHGWVPMTVQVLTAMVLGCAIRWRSRRWLRRSLPVIATVALAITVWAHWYLGTTGAAGDPAPWQLWLWVGLSGLAVGVLVLGWAGARWWWRAVSFTAVPLCVLSTAFALNGWVGYFPTLHSAWSQLTSGPLPDQTGAATITAMQLAGVIPAKGAVVAVTISGAPSQFTHRDELVYLPPAWFASNPPPPLPTVMMIGGEFNTPTDWLRAGEAITTLDAFASAHGGNAPVAVFVDSGGRFNVDTECVNGPRGNAADHLTNDVIPYMTARFGVSPEQANWGVVGFSAGGTCAIDLAVMHPNLFHAFVDIAGDIGPNSGTKAQTIDRLFGGNADAWASFDPTTVIAQHGEYTTTTGLYAVPGTPTAGVDGRDGTVNPGGQDAAANALCALGSRYGIPGAVVVLPGKHDWPFAGTAFASTLPWLAGELHTPTVARSGLPTPNNAPPAPFPRPTT